LAPRLPSSVVVRLATLIVASIIPAHAAAAQATRPQWEGVPPVRMSEGDVHLLHTADAPDILVRVLTTGLAHPWSLAFLPSGDILVTERPGRLRVIRDGVLDPTPVGGVPQVSLEGQFTGLLEVALHPRFAENRLIYLTYRTPEESRVALARGRYDGTALSDFRVLFRAGGEPFATSSGSRLLFAPDGTLFMPVGGTPNAGSSGLRAQDPADPAGKILRLRDDGTAPGTPEPDGTRPPPGDGRAVGHRARAAGRRRSERGSAGPQLRLAAGVTRFVGSLMVGESSGPDTSSASSSTRRARRSVARRCSRSSGSGFGTSGRGPTASSTSSPTRTKGRC
jgi:glucose/arabinose dehydrogenase